MKRLMAVLAAGLMVLSMAGCAKKEKIVGTWKIDWILVQAEENGDSDYANRETNASLFEYNFQAAQSPSNQRIGWFKPPFVSSWLSVLLFPVPGCTVLLLRWVLLRNSGSYSFCSRITVSNRTPIYNPASLSGSSGKLSS